MNRIKLFRSSLIILFVYLVVIIVLSLMVPADARIPMHWNAQGEIDGWASRTSAMIFALGLNIFLFLLLYLMPWYSPKYRKQQKRFDDVLPQITNILLIFFGLINLYALAWPLGGDQIPANPILVIIGLLFALLGNLLPKVPRNFFVGIRTPWTIMDEENWHKTHRLGAWLFVIGGIMMILKGILPLSSTLQIISTWGVIAILLFPVLYSFILFRRNQR